MKRVFRAVGLMLPLAVLQANAQIPASAEKPLVELAWASATVPGQPVAAAYMRITSLEPVSLMRIETPVAKRVQVHMMRTEEGVMKMRNVGELHLPAGKSVELAPGGTHLMLLGLKRPLNTGENIPITLTFVDAARQKTELVINVPVRQMGQ